MSTTVTALCTLIYANLGNPDFFDIFEAFMNQLDAKLYANREDLHLILTGGGTVTLDDGADTLEWTQDFELVNVLTGGVVTIAADTLTGFEDGKIAYCSVSRPVTGAKTGTLVVADYLGSGLDKAFIALRRGTVAHMRSSINSVS
jgi:hypothetical protein